MKLITFFETLVFISGAIANSNAVDLSTKDNVVTRTGNLLGKAQRAVMGKQLEHSDKTTFYNSNPFGVSIFYDNGHQQEVLKYRAHALLTRANNAIQLLKTQGKMNEIRILEQEAANLKQLVTKLETHRTSSDLAQIEGELRSAELRLLRELQRLHLDHHSIFRRNLKADLVTKGNRLLKKSSSILLKLGSVHNTREMSFIKREEKLIKRLIEQLAVAHEEQHINHIEHCLRIAELRMSYYLNQATQPYKELPNHRQLLKKILEQRAKNEDRQAEEIIARLHAEKKVDEAETIKKSQLVVRQLVKQMQQIKTDAHLLLFEQTLTVAENRLSREISKALRLPGLL